MENLLRKYENKDTEGEWCYVCSHNTYLYLTYRILKYLSISLNIFFPEDRWEGFLIKYCLSSAEFYLSLVVFLKLLTLGTQLTFRKA